MRSRSFVLAAAAMILATTAASAEPVRARPVLQRQSEDDAEDQINKAKGKRARRAEKAARRAAREAAQ